MNDAFPLSRAHNTADAPERKGRYPPAVHLADLIVWDNHVCLPIHPDGHWFDQLERHRAAGATFVSVNIGDAEVPLETMLAMADCFRAAISAQPDRYVLATSVDIVRRAKTEGRLAVAFDIEGMRALGDDIRLIERFYALGVRWMLIAYNCANLIGAGCHDADDHGLTPLGRRFLDEMDRVGMVICCSHTGYRTSRDVLERATKPVIFSHSNALALRQHPRNIPDDLIRLCARTGGVVGINGLSVFLGGTDRLVERLVDHIDHVAGVAGHSHVGLGLDYVYDQDDLMQQLEAARNVWPAGFGYEPGITFVEPEQLPAITDLLLTRGFSDDDVRGIMGGNFMRVAEAVWR